MCVMNLKQRDVCIMCIRASVSLLFFPTDAVRSRTGAPVPVLLDSTAHECGDEGFGVAGLCPVLQGLTRDDSVTIPARDR
jgi:hypothetical protein